MKKLVTLIMIVTVILTMSGCNKQEEEKITLGFLPSLTAVPYIYAIEEGYYEEHGIEVEYQNFMSAKARDAALSTKADGVNAVSSDLVMLLLNNESGLDMKFTVETQEIFTMVSKPGSSYASVADTDGATFGGSEMTVIEFLADKIASENNITYDQQVINRVPDRFATLSSGGIDLAIMPEPFPTKVIVDGNENGEKGKEVWNNGNYYITALGFKADFIEEHPDVVKKFHEATNEAIADLKTKDLSDYKQYIIDYGILEAQYLDETSDQFVGEPVFKSLVAPKEDVFDDALAWLTNNGYIENNYTYDDLYYKDWNQE